ncbi:tetratricopeptide repeat protein [Haliscomenobacter hydrossis]|uniref:Uncharacterized protein n=1 Tax=Haliscomenobacter hydrossis (strain ATCC 27775 / DSM 1100 / LMG 10767 / O) TaxID=760192 RepID=F4L244_HALH1|nr:hypothetical protein [Haliscomenobacter hydrossis]AEE51651.1 hypothetical protein Halhy_3799 [Haliscomenobacter hydrossis DSM 1100]
MQNSQLIHILSSLSKKETRELRKWLVSPIHNQRSDVVQLYEYLTSSNRLEDDKSLEKERIFRKLYPKEAYDDAKMRQAIHFLQESVEEYLMYVKSKDDGLTQYLGLAKIYREKKLLKLHEKTMKKIEEDFQNAPHRNEEIFERSYLIEKEKSTMFIERSRAVSTNYQEMSNSMEMTFISRKLKLACAMLSHQKIYKTNYDFGLLEGVLTYLNGQNQSQLINDPTIKLYYHLYNLFKFPDEEFHFFEIKQVLSSSEHFFDPLERKDVYLMIINYCISRMNIGFKSFVREAFEFYRKAIESRIIFEHGMLNHLAFRNIVTAGTTLKEFDWVSSFIEEYQQYLGPEYRDNFVKFALARLYFEQGDYDRAQDLLIQFDIDDILINLTAKTMLIRLYYEKDEFLALESLLDSMRAYINRKKMLAYHKMSFKELISASKRLIKIQFNDRKKIEVLQNQINNSRILPSHMKEWFMEQLKKLRR